MERVFRIVCEPSVHLAGSLLSDLVVPDPTMPHAIDTRRGIALLMNIESRTMIYRLESSLDGCGEPFETLCIASCYDFMDLEYKRFRFESRLRLKPVLKSPVRFLNVNI